jgi:hypothetical protein
MGYPLLISFRIARALRRLAKVRAAGRLCASVLLLGRNRSRALSSK